MPVKCRIITILWGSSGKLLERPKLWPLALPGTVIPGGLEPPHLACSGGRGGADPRALIKLPREAGRDEGSGRPRIAPPYRNGGG